VRVRVNGILVKDDALLLVQLKSPLEDQLIWMPPGGGVRFGESLESAAKREIAEEIAENVREGDFDHVIMGRSGRGKLEVLFMGSVTQKVISLVDVPVTIVK